MRKPKATREQFVSLKINASALMHLLSSKSIVAQDIQCLDPGSKKVVSELLLDAAIEANGYG